MDDASPDNCAAIAEGYAERDPRLRVIRRELNGGVSRAFNTGFAAARGEYFCRLAQDDLFREDAIEVMLDYMESHQDCGLVYHDGQFIDEAGRVIGQPTAPEPSEALADGNGVSLCAMWRRSVWDKVAGFDPEFDTAEDFEYWLRVSKHFNLHKLSGCAPFFFRVHEQMGSKQFEVRQEFAHWGARIRHCGSWWEARRLKSRCYAEVAYIHRSNQRIAPAFYCVMLSVIYWPFFLKSYRIFIRTLWDAWQLAAGKVLDY